LVSWISTLAVASLIGINTALIQAVARGYEGSFWLIFRTKLKFSLLATVAGLAGAIYYWQADNLVLAWSFLIIGLLIPLLKTSGLYLSVLYGRKDFKAAAAYTGIVRIVSTLALIGTLLLTDNLYLILLAFFLPETIAQLWVTRHALRRDPLRPQLDVKTKEYGIHLSIMEFLKVVAGQADKLLLFHYLGAAELAVYSFALAIPDQLKSFLQNITSLALPKMSAARSADLRRHLPGKILRLELIVAALILLYIPTAPHIYKIFFPQYVDAIAYSQILAISLLFLPRTFLSTAMVAQGKRKELYSIRILSPISRIALLFFFLKWWGLWGLVIGKLASDAGQLFIYRYFFNQAFKEKPKNHPERIGSASENQ
jgi:O-antigen/teichoic acid export membrane protein